MKIELIKQNEESKNKNNRKNQLEVQDFEFKSDEPITNSIMFNGRLFVIDRYQSKANSDIINYRCKTIENMEIKRIEIFVMYL